MPQVIYTPALPHYCKDDLPYVPEPLPGTIVHCECNAYWKRADGFWFKVRWYHVFTRRKIKNLSRVDTESQSPNPPNQTP